jgi:hypothetical protein
VTNRQHQSSKLACTLALLFIATPIAGCSDSPPIEVSSRYGTGIKFTGLGSTFAWAPAPAPDPQNPLLGNPESRQLVHDTVEKHLVAKGFQLSSGGPADFWVDYRLTKRDKTDSGVNPHGEVFEEGSLVLDVLDPQSGKLIWRSVARARLNLATAPEVKEKRLNLAVQRLMKDFPPK